MPDHHSLEAWQEAYEVAYGLTVAARDQWKPWAAAMFSQGTRASLSVQLNITEGWTFGPSPTATRHLSIAYGSAKETADVLELMERTGALPADQIAELQARSRRCIGLLIGMLKKRRPMQSARR